MALSTADLQAAYLRGDRFVTINASGAATETHQEYSSAHKAGGHPTSSVSILASNGVLTGISSTIADKHDYGKKR